MSIDNADPVAVLRTAVRVASDPLFRLNDQSARRPSPVVGEVVNRALGAFVATARPVQAQLAALISADPLGPVAEAVNHVRVAFGHFGSDEGRLDAACAELEAAQKALEGREVDELPNPHPPIRG
ncbi:hypothetical protein [Umezawaea sp. Da 62-37]|uniref:hypothetical protein n=1 Tax=Umezawaea sp. Da 62-37 TaxID=3075927 RepID=UPI0028F722A1|nr:hypothetical protein [Umezawaea sp. Da 62-37]WNV89050.1 hypothetical protein RM788_12325 [Umezawaea sp. Da 62-37]